LDGWRNKTRQPRRKFRDRKKEKEEDRDIEPEMILRDLSPGTSQKSWGRAWGLPYLVRWRSSQSHLSLGVRTLCSAAFSHEWWGYAKKIWNGGFVKVPEEKENTVIKFPILIASVKIWVTGCPRMFQVSHPP
jgi:hypothetical protein